MDFGSISLATRTKCHVCMHISYAYNPKRNHMLSSALVEGCIFAAPFALQGCTTCFQILAGGYQKIMSAHSSQRKLSREPRLLRGGHFGLLKASVALPNLHRICDPKLQGAVTPWSFKAYRAGPPAPAVGNHASVQRPSCRTPTLIFLSEKPFCYLQPLLVLRALCQGMHARSFK